MEKSLSLYAMTTAMMDILEAEEVNEEMMEAAFGAIVSKDNRIAYFIRDVESAIDAHKAEEKRIADRRKAMENKIKSLKGLIQMSMERLELDKIDTGVFKLAIQNNPAALEVIDREATPNAYRVIIPETWEPDNARIKDALKAGEEVAGYALKVGRSLRIR